MRDVVRRWWPWGMCQSVHTSPYWPISYVFACEGKKRHEGDHFRRVNEGLITWDGTFRVR